MAHGTLHEVRRYEAWHAAAHTGRWTAPGGASLPVMLLYGSAVPEPGELDRARDTAAAWGGMPGAEGLSTLVGVVPHANRVAWMYQDVPGLGLVHTLSNEDGPLLSARAVAELVGRVAQRLVAAGSWGLRHRGPEPCDLLLDARGNVYVAAFASPFPPSPEMRSPRGGDDAETAAVYRLGVLMAHLVSGVAPAPAIEKAVHASLVRRALIRAMARPGPVLSERFGDWLRGMLAWDPRERPALTACAEGLVQVASTMGGLSLQEWSAERVPKILAEIDRRALWSSEGGLDRDEPTAENLHTEESGEGDLANTGEHTMPAPIDLEYTGEVAGRAVRRYTDPERTAEGNIRRTEPRTRDRPYPNTMPVLVGPPPEVLRELPRLPPGFLDSASSIERPVLPNTTGRMPPMTTSAGADTRWLAGWVLAAAGLSIASVALALYLFGGPQARGAVESSLSEAIGEQAFVAGQVSVEPSPNRGPAAPVPALASPDPQPAGVTLQVAPGAALRPAVSAAKDAPPPPWGVVFRTSGRIKVSCDGGNALGRDEVLVTGLGPTWCDVEAIAADGGLRRASVAVDRPGVVDCFGARSGCSLPVER